MCFLPQIPAQAQYQYYYVTSIITIFLNIGCAAWTTVANVLILLTLAKTTSLQTPSILLLASLTANDVIVGAILQPVSVTRSLYWLLAKNFCMRTNADIVRRCFLHLCRLNSLSSLVIISWDRYTAIARPYRYKVLVTKSRVSKVIPVVWCINVVATCVDHFVIGTSANLLKLIPYIILGFLLIVIQISVVCAYKRHTRKMLTQQSMSDNMVTQRMAIEKHISVTVAIIIAALLVSYLPIIVFFIMRIVGKSACNYLRLMSQWLELILYTNAAVNPLIYFRRNSELKMV